MNVHNTESAGCFNSQISNSFVLILFTGMDRPIPKPRPRPRQKPQPIARSASNVIGIDKQIGNPDNSNPPMNHFYSCAAEAPSSVNSNLNSNVFMSAQPEQKTLQRSAFQLNRTASTTTLMLSMRKEFVELRNEIFPLMMQSASDDKFLHIVKQLAAINCNVNEKYAYLTYRDLLNNNSVCKKNYHYQGTKTKAN